ncbi:MAG TPA: NADH-quinone oxidoreductase subunit J [Terriglobia bacterium]|nr:NADH-quinone oxidoreductase subunit J [Terriglobia bacterium]
MLELILFYIFAVIAVVSAVLVITQRNVVHSAVSLAGTLLAVAGIFLTLHAEFLAGVQVIVYVGGILVLFVFVIMLIALERSLTERQFHRQGRIALVTCAILIVELAYGLYKGKDTFPPIPGETAAAGFNLSQNSQRVGEALYQNYLLPFEIASILLLVAIVGAVALAKRKTEVEE